MSTEMILTIGGLCELVILAYCIVIALALLGKRTRRDLAILTKRVNTLKTALRRERDRRCERQTEAEEISADLEDLRRALRNLQSQQDHLTLTRNLLAKQSQLPAAAAAHAFLDRLLNSAAKGGLPDATSREMIAAVFSMQSAQKKAVVSPLHDGKKAGRTGALTR